MDQHPLPPVSGNGEYATVRLADYLLAVRDGDLAVQHERDRRYAEVKAAEEKALKVKEEADKTALGLQRDNQFYRDEKANNLREQIERERGTYATQLDLKGLTEKLETLVKPLSEFVAGQQGRAGGRTESRLDLGTLIQVLAFLIVAATLILKK
jgi:vacuolar-type H+-ATPase subunit H